MQWPSAYRSLTRIEREMLEFRATKTVNASSAKTPELENIKDAHLQSC